MVPDLVNLRVEENPIVIDEENESIKTETIKTMVNNVIDFSEEMLPCNIGIKNLRPGELLFLFRITELILDKAHIPSSLESRIQREHVLVAGIHRAEDRHIGRDGYLMAITLINDLSGFAISRVSIIVFVY